MRQTEAVTRSDAPRTEQVDHRYADLDVLDERNLLERLLNDQETAISAVRASLGDLSLAVSAASERLGRGGRLVYVGAGTSGRLGMIDAAELPPTFGWPRERAVNLTAGGSEAFFRAVENAEDDREAAERDYRRAKVHPHDVVIAVAASGTTPYVLRVLELARAAGALTIGIANNAATPLLRGAEHAVLLDTGPEVLSGSTRLKAGTAQKIALNLFSTAVMVRLGKVYQNLMVDLVATNTKLVNRATALVQRTTQVGPDQAAAQLRAADGQVKTAIAMTALHVDAGRARELLDAHAGQLRRLLPQDRPGATARALSSGLVVSCQASADNPLHGPQFMRAMALAAQLAGAAGVRANGASDIRAIRDACDLPIIGIRKVFGAHDVSITPDFESARLVARAGADVIAIDATRRPRPVPIDALIRFIQQELGKRVMADVSSEEEGQRAAALGVDYVATTLSGYTRYSPQIAGPDLGLVRTLAASLPVPVIAEGRIRDAHDIIAVRDAGAFGAVVGTAITNPRELALNLAHAWAR